MVFLFCDPAGVIKVCLFGDENELLTWRKKLAEQWQILNLAN
jgi:hypothetical protein